ncbi:MAG: nucleotidyltransferase substrate binding protein [Methylohalobius sp.]|nr:nucleotidyltransferase substrate binding protein [Methylohalobius sp.]
MPRSSEACRPASSRSGFRPPAGNSRRIPVQSEAYPDPRGLIQRFEFTYEMAYKTLKRYLEWASPAPEEIDRLTFPDLIRTASEQDLLKGDWPQWRTYREMRNKTSRT